MKGKVRQGVLLGVAVAALLGTRDGFAGQGEPLYSWGGTGRDPGQFDDPEDLAVDADGYVYVGDTGRIQKFAADGTFVTQFGSWSTALAVDPAGYVYSADDVHIYKFTSDGTAVSQWGSSGTGPGEYAFILGLAVDGDGNVYVADNGNQRVQKLSGAGDFLWSWPDSGREWAQCICWRNDAEYVGSYDHVNKLDPDGVLLMRIQADTFDPQAIAADSNGNVYVASCCESGFRVFDPAGTRLGWLSAGSGITGVGISGSGIVYVSLHDSNQVVAYPTSAVPVRAMSWGRLKRIYGTPAP